jgi:hypothetical protein
MSEDEVEWLKLPNDLQHRFYELAEKESNSIKEKISELRKEIEELKVLLRGKVFELKRSKRKYVVAAVDGSRSPTLSERLGVRYGVFSVGTVYLDGNNRREEFGAGVFKRRQALSQDESKYMFDISSLYYERQFAEKAIDNSDLVLIDGSFYGFVYTALKMKQQGYYGEYHDQVVRKTFELTNRLIESKNVIGVIKRSHTRAIGGYLASKNRKSILTSIIDKLILAIVMPRMSYFRYDDMLGKESVSLYSYISTLIAKGKTFSEALVEDALTKIYRPFNELNLDAGYFKKLKRMQIKAHESLPPCEIEYPQTIDVNYLLDVLGQENFFNEATNLPIALDLVDSLIGLSPKFAYEFANEIEGRIIQLLEKDNDEREVARIFFSLLNPQKPY